MPLRSGKIFLTAILFFVAAISFSQHSRKLDSLYTLLKSAKADSSKALLHLKIAGLVAKEDTVVAEREIKMALAIANKINDPNLTLRLYDKAGSAFSKAKQYAASNRYYQVGLIKSRLFSHKLWQCTFYGNLAWNLRKNDLTVQCSFYYDSALALAKKVASEKNVAYLYSQRGRAAYDNGNYKSAMADYMEAQKLFDKNKWRDADLCGLYHFIGSVFKRQDQPAKAIEYYEKELALAIEIKNKDEEAEALYLCAQIYGELGDKKKDEECTLKALKIYEELDDKKSVALMHHNIAINYSNEKNYAKAIEHLEKSMKVYDELGFGEGRASTYETLGNLYSKTGQHKKAFAALDKAMEIAEKTEMKRLLNIVGITESMAYAYARGGDYKEAYYNLLDHRTLNDSLNNQSNVEYLHSLETQFQTEKKEKEIALLNTEKKLQSEEIATKTAQERTLAVISILGLIVAVVSVIAFVNKRKSSRLLTKQVNEINYQNEVIREKNKDITDSIQYAKRLQEAVFPEATQLNHYFAESFVLFRPKDIVSGDFYWFEQSGDKTILAVGDCTGHGVPGAFMSILGHNLLNQIILEYQITNPAEILRMLDKQVSSALNKKGTRNEYNDGMDIAIVVLDKKAKTFSFAGANRPLIIKRGDDVIELKPNKFAIGGIQDDTCKVFMPQQMEAKPNDVFYLFSDGYYDQFGGPEGKKLKYRNLVNFIGKIGTLSMSDQKNTLEKNFTDWQGNLEQLDDVCVVGVRV
jgi:serine phosphatase RsbU (regulator of sigma subunit)